jgi:hypothetical protein
MTTVAEFSKTPSVDEDLLAVLLAYRRELSDQELAELTQRSGRSAGMRRASASSSNLSILGK